MDSRPIAGRAVFHSVLASILALMVFGSGCVPPKKKMPKGEDVTSAPAAPASAAAPAKNPLSRTWQRLIALEGKSGGFGSIAISNAVAQKSEEVSSAKNSRLIVVSMDVTGQLRKPFVEAVMTLDASPARITGVESDANPAEAAAAFANKGRAEWRMQSADGRPPVSQKLRLQIEAPKGMEPVEIRIQRFFKKANGDMFNSTSPTPENIEAQRLLDAIQKELSRFAKGAVSDVFWPGVGDCKSAMGEEKNGQCYPTEDSWRLAEKRTAVLCGTPWQEKLTLPVSGVAAALKKQEAVTPLVETPKPAEVVQPVEAPKPVEAAQPMEETPKPAEVVQPVEVSKPVEATPAAEEAPKPAEAAQPVEAPKPAVAAKPKPAVAPKAQQEQAKKPAAKAVPKKGKANGDGKPIYDLSDVLGKQQ